MTDSPELRRELEEERSVNETLRRIGTSLTSELELDRLVQLLTDEATALCGAQFGAFFYTVNDDKGESFMLYTISGVPREAFSKFPMPRNTAVFAPTFAGQGVVRSDDITKDPRYGHSPPHHGMPAGHLPVCSYLAVPVISRTGSVIGGLFFGHSEPAVFAERDERMMVAVAAQASVAFDNAQLYAESTRARIAAEAMQDRFRFLAEASDALAESLDYEATLRRVADLAVPRIADWCTISIVDDQGELRRVAAVHHDKSLQARMAEYEANYPPTQHRAGGLTGAFASGKTLFQPTVTDGDLEAAAQNDAHLRLLRAIGCTSCLMVPIIARSRPIGIVSLNCANGARRFSVDDQRAAEELAHRAALAIDNARLYRTMQHREAANAFLADATAVLGTSLDYAATLQSLANLVVPRYADWCAVDILEAGGKIRQVAVAHVDPKKVAYAHELQRRWPPDPNGPTGAPAVIRSGESELFADIPEELLLQVVTDPEQLQVLRDLGLRSALTVPLAARGRTLGALTLIWAESGRSYGPDDVPLMEELGRRAGLAVDNARLYDEAQAAVRLRDEFLSIASHELRTPLTSMQLQVSNLLRVLGKQRPENLTTEFLMPRLGHVDRQVDRLAVLIGSLLDVTRATSGRLHLELEDVDLAELVRQVVGRLEPDLRSAGCDVTVAVEEGLVGRWDRLRLDQIVTNLLSNALKYGAGKAIEIAARRTDAGAVSLVVRDHGIGISAADQTRIFDRFARAVPAEHFGGLGLGLWIVRVFVEAMHGTVAVASETGMGAAFTLELPLRIEND
jgi:signal transduction histidine kinase